MSLPTGRGEVRVRSWGLRRKWDWTRDVRIGSRANSGETASGFIGTCLSDGSVNINTSRSHQSRVRREDRSRIPDGGKRSIYRWI
jgi:hypothetical protein